MCHDLNSRQGKTSAWTLAIFSTFQHHLSICHLPNFSYHSPCLPSVSMSLFLSFSPFSLSPYPKGVWNTCPLVAITATFHLPATSGSTERSTRPHIPLNNDPKPLKGILCQHAHHGPWFVYHLSTCLVRCSWRAYARCQVSQWLTNCVPTRVWRWVHQKWASNAMNMSSQSVSKQGHEDSRTKCEQAKPWIWAHKVWASNATKVSSQSVRIEGELW